MSGYWVGKREGDEGEGTIRIIRRADDDDVKGHPFSRRTPQVEQTDDTEGQMPWSRRQVEPEGDDTIGHPYKRLGPIDEEQGLYLIEVDSDEDVIGQRIWHPFGQTDDDTEGQRRT